MSSTRLPESLPQFVAQTRTKPVADLWKYDPKEHHSSYGSYWYRAIACILLSGRVQPKFDGTPNMTDVNRVGKEANFNQYLTERVGKVLVAMKVVESDRRQDEYKTGPNLNAFWDHDVKRLPAIARQAVLRLVGYLTDTPFWHPKARDDAPLTAFLSVFFTCFRGLALVESQLGQIFHDFAQLPPDDLTEVARTLGVNVKAATIDGWKKMLEGKGQKALVEALTVAEWLYYHEHQKVEWCFASPIGLGMLGLEPPPPAPELATMFQALPDRSIFAGAGLAWKKLVPLFRYGVIQRIDQVYEIKLDPKRLAEAPATCMPADELRVALRELEPLPPAIADLLATKTPVRGKVGIRGCSALVKPENAEVLAAIREHPQLKGYIEPGAPPGYLLVKMQSDPNNFVRRCQNLGFEVKML